MRKKSPDREWMVKLLALWKPDDEIFAKSYRYTPPKKVVVADYEFKNEDGFFDELPPLTENEIRNSRRLRIPKVDRLRMKLQSLQSRKDEFAEYEAKLKAKLQEAEDDEEDPLDEFMVDDDEEEEVKEPQPA